MNVGSRRYVRKGSAAFKALQHLQSQGCLLPRDQFRSYIETVATKAYAEEVIGNLLDQRFIETGLVQITEAGRMAIARANRRARPKLRKD